MQIIIGLGNPGTNYAHSRHNAAWIALDLLIGEDEWRFEKRFNAQVKQVGENIFVKPQTFMNNSGESAFKILKYYHLLATRFPNIIKKDQILNDTLFVIHDDLDLNLGTWKISNDSRSGGNKGVQSIIDHLKTQKFTRLRLGIKNSLLRQPIQPEKFVLQAFEQTELAPLKNAVIQGYESLKQLM